MNIDVMLVHRYAGVGSDVAAWVTHLGEPQFLLPVVFLLFWWKQPAFGRRGYWARLVLSAALTTAVVQVAKAQINRPRPGAVIAKVRSLPGGHLRAKAFPSGHTATAAWVAGALWFIVRLGPLAFLFILLSAAVAWSRVAIGAHWPSDVAVGWMLGFMIPALAAMRRHRQPEMDDL
jgi:membrane-associated phospholipid phosphatase